MRTTSIIIAFLSLFSIIVLANVASYNASDFYNVTGYNVSGNLNMTNMSGEGATFDWNESLVRMTQIPSSLIATYGTETEPFRASGRAICRTNNAIHVVAINRTTDVLYYNSTDGITWRFKKLDGSAAGDNPTANSIVAIACSGTKIAVFWRGDTYDLQYMNSSDEGATWSPYISNFAPKWFDGTGTSNTALDYMSAEFGIGNNLWVAWGHDAGTVEAIIVDNSTLYGGNLPPLTRKNMTIDTLATVSPHLIVNISGSTEEVYVPNFGVGSDIEINYTTNGGTTWAGREITAGTFVAGAVSGVILNNVIYVVYATTTTISIKNSTNRGTTWSAATTVATETTSDPTIATDGINNLWIFWNNGTASTNRNDIRYRQWNGSSGWSPIVTWQDLNSYVLTRPNAKFNYNSNRIEVVFINRTSSSGNIDLRYDTLPARTQYYYGVELWHNSTPTNNIGAGDTINSVNATIKFNATYAGTYALLIYNWTGGKWDTCQAPTVVTANTWTQFNCSACASGCGITTATSNDYRSPDSNQYIRIAINETQDHAIQAQLKEDYIQYWVDYTPVTPIAALINSVTLNAPTSDLDVAEGYQFNMNCTPDTNNRPGINITFEYNTTTSSWMPIPITGVENLTIDVPNPNVNVLNNTMYNHTVTAQTLETYWIRCRAYNSTTSVYSTIRRIDVRKIILSINQTYPSYLTYTMLNPLLVEPETTFEINSTVKCESQAPSGSCENVYCSVRYNSTGATANALISNVQGATPFYVIGGVAQNSTYNFSGITSPSATHEAEYGAASFIIGIQTGTEATTGEYSFLSPMDSVDWSKSSSSASTVWQQFRFVINEPVSAIKGVSITHVGSGEGYFSSISPSPNIKTDLQLAPCPILLERAQLYVWNFTSGSWSSIGQHIFSFDDTIVVNFASNFNDIINASGFMYVLVSANGEVGCSETVRTDFVKVDVESEAINTKACGVLNVGQECNLTWVVNATGAEDTLWAIDTNCTSSSPKIAENDTVDTYVKIKTGPKVSVDKPSYKSCGIVYYKTSVYDLSDNPVDSNITVRLIDPLGFTRSSFNASTTSGVYLSTYLLEPSAALGEWIIKVSSCSISKGYFEVGQGNSELWKIDISSPTKVKFSSGESMSIDFVVYNLKGERVSNLLSSSLILSLDTNDITSSCSDLGDGAYRCTTSAPVSSGAHYININARAVGGTINVTNSKSFFVE